MLDHITSEPGLRYLMIGFAVLCAVMGFARGLARLVLFGLALAAGAAAAMGWLRYAPELCISWFNRVPPGFIQWGALVCGLLVAWFARRFLNALVTGEPVQMDRSSRVRGGLLGFIPAVLLLWGGAVALRWVGAADRLRHVQEAVDAADLAPLADQSLPARLGGSLSRGMLGDLLNRIDPLKSRESVAAGTLLVLQRIEPVWDRAIHHPQTGPVILQPSFKRLREDKDVRHALSFAHYSRLLALPELSTALDDRVLREALLAIDFETVLPEIITGRAAPPIPRAVPVPEPAP